MSRLEARLEDVAAALAEQRTLLAALARDDPGRRAELFALRESPEYELAFADEAPLVTVAIATAGQRDEALVDRAIASALAQTHSPIEVVVVGDATGEATRAAVEGVGDPRVRFVDLTQSYAHPNPSRRWMTGVCDVRNEAMRLARGRWIADLDDDDALRPDAVERLLVLAREHRVEVAYGLKEQHAPSGERTPIGTFPPGPGPPDWRERGLPWQPWEGAASCGALVHAGLRLFGREHVAADLGVPGDFFRLERMLRAGVRFGMLDEVVYDYWPSTPWD